MILQLSHCKINPRGKAARLWTSGSILLLRSIVIIHCDPSESPQADSMPVILQNRQHPDTVPALPAVTSFFVEKIHGSVIQLQIRSTVSRIILSWIIHTGSMQQRMMRHPDFASPATAVAAAGMSMFMSFVAAALCFRVEIKFACQQFFHRSICTA